MYLDNWKAKGPAQHAGTVRTKGLDLGTASARDKELRVKVLSETM